MKVAAKNECAVACWKCDVNVELVQKARLPNTQIKVLDAVVMTNNANMSR
jgi:hypothetical protein